MTTLPVRLFDQRAQSSFITRDVRLPVVDGLRGMAIFAVILFHIHAFAIGPAQGPWENLYSKAVDLGWVGVDLFFVLSGFLITGILIDSQKSKTYYKTFYARRTLRIFPLYYFALFIFFVMSTSALKACGRNDLIKQWIVPQSQIVAWTYTVNFLLALAPRVAFPVALSHFWSLAVEEQFYLIWPLVVRKFSHQIFGMMCVSLGFASLLFRVIFLHFQMASASHFLTVCRLDALVAGAAVALLIRNERRIVSLKRIAPISTAFSGIALVTIIIATGHGSYSTFWMASIGMSFWAIFFGSLLATVLVSEPAAILPRTASLRFFRFLGKYSYCLYICHQPISILLSQLGVNGNHMGQLLGNRGTGVVIVNAAILSLSLSVSLLSWHLIEKHFLNLKNLPLFKYS